MTDPDLEKGIAAANPRGLAMVAKYRADGFPVQLSDFTCARCLRETECEFSWDLYNTDGDCLAVK